MKKNLLFAIALIISISAIAQLQQGGIPLSTIYKNAIKKEVPIIMMSTVDVARLKAEDQINDRQKDIPWRFGENLYVDISPENSGVWENLNNNYKVWRVAIKSVNAISINLTFNDFMLSDKAKLFVYNHDKTEVLGAFTSLNNQADGMFATTLIEGDEIVLEYSEPINAVVKSKLHLWRVTHGYRSAYNYSRALGDAGSCNNNVVCPEAAAWQNEVKSVCMLVSGGSGFCTGTLINNTANDGTPYVLTANHCSASNDFATWVFWYNWQSATCINPTVSPAYNSLSGSVLKARNAGSDFCLVQMNNTPPATFDVRYAGWSKVDVPATRATCIHHPSGDIKKISFADSATLSATFSSAQCWQAFWTDGITEPGSSGSPLFDQNHRIIGQLYGGPSSCTAAATDWNDYYGKFAVSWNGANSASRLVDWLDPSNTGDSVVNTFDPNMSPPTANFTADITETCTGAVSFSNLSNNAVSYQWSFGDGTTSSINNPTHSYTSNGTYTVSLFVENTFGSDTLVKSNYIFVNMPTAPTTVSASNCGSGPVQLLASGNGTLNWYDSLTAGNLVFTGDTFNINNLANTTTYYVENAIDKPLVHGGPASNTIGTGNYYTGGTFHYVKFDCFSTVKLKSILVYANSAGNRTIQLQNSNGIMMLSKTVNIPQGESRVTLDFDVPVGTNLRLALSAGNNIYRNTAGAAFPYQISNLIKITGTSATQPAYYYYFFDWEIQGTPCVSSRTLVIASISGLPVSASITANSGNIICSGAMADFYVNAVNAGVAPTYHWLVNSDTLGANSATFSSSNIHNGDSIFCIIVSDDSCAINNPAVSNTIHMQVVSVPPTPIITQVYDTLISSSAIGNQWYDSAGAISGATGSSFIPTQNGNYYAVVILPGGCVSDTSNVIHYVAIGINSLNTNDISVSPNPCRNRVFVDLKPTINTNSQLLIINLTGQVVLSKMLDNSGRTAVDISSINKGFYFYQVIINGTSAKLGKLTILQ